MNQKKLIIREPTRFELPLGIYIHYKSQLRIPASHLQASPMHSTPKLALYTAKFLNSTTIKR
jgi:hypothetical protein